MEQETIKNIAKKIIDKYNLPYKEAEYLAARIISKQTIPHILERLKEKRISTLKLYSVCPDKNQKDKFMIGLNKRVNLIKFLESNKSEGLSEI